MDLGVNFLGVHCRTYRREGVRFGTGIHLALDALPKDARRSISAERDGLFFYLLNLWLRHAAAQRFQNRSRTSINLCRAGDRIHLANHPLPSA